MATLKMLNNIPIEETILWIGPHKEFIKSLRHLTFYIILTNDMCLAIKYEEERMLEISECSPKSFWLTTIKCYL
jgi:hypothetical protein